MALSPIAIHLASASGSPSAVDFQRDIRPLLASRCFKCHGPSAQQAGLRFDTREGTFKRNAVVPGKPEVSRLLARVQADEATRMPPAETGDRLSPAEVAKLRAWIASGAEWSPHWAYVPPVAKPPARQGAGVRNPVDHFIQSKLQSAGLRPSPEADRRTLIRRVALDLTGLLPSPDEVEAFVADARPDAYELVVERLLNSPHYGERQTRHWLDLARYADSNGYTIDGPRSIWPYRDWVLAAFNRDLPFDQFTIAQLAGDLLPNAAREQLIATGFHRNTPFNEEGGTNAEQFRVERTIDRTNTTGTVWLGLTVGCAQCHNHKFDLISQREYYQLYAFFNQCDEPQHPLPTAEQEQRLSDLRASIVRAKSLGVTNNQRLELTSAPAITWSILSPREMRSENGTHLRRLEDDSVLADGQKPETDAYTVVAAAPAGTFSAVRLEAMLHMFLPNMGPGRAANGNFVLSHFTLEVDGAPVKFARAVADHSQKNYDVNEALLGDRTRGWAISVEAGKGNANVERQAAFIVERPLTLRAGQRLTFVLTFAEQPERYALGRFRLALTSANEREVAATVGAASIDNAVLTRLQSELKKFETEISTTLVMRPAAQARATNIQLRGDFLQVGEAVEPGVFATLPALTDAKPTRLELAQWLVSGEHPLTGRVVVNRLWQQCFGRGIVETENDFGMQGSAPTHPALLDWLAVEFVRRGWSLKDMLRLIVTSASYRQSSAVGESGVGSGESIDPQNKLWWRAPRLRLEAEAIRDVALMASGLLARRLGGPGVFPPQPREMFLFTQSNHPWVESQGADRYRRGMYTYLWRQSLHPLLTTFDGVDAQTSCTRRNRSNTPLQALHLANAPAFIEFAEALGQRIVREGPGDDRGRLDFAFRVCFARPPSEAETMRLFSYLEAQRAANPESAWTMVSRVLLNLDEFITRE